MAEFDRVTGRKAFAQRLINLFPKELRLRLNPRRHEIEHFIKEIAKKTPKNSRILDAGAGPCPYKHFFSHCKYEATDYVNPYKILDFTCTLDKIPRPSKTYDAVLCTEVLEHVEFPQKVVKELYRVLNKSGRLYLTCPQGWMLHQEPHNYFYFTKYGLFSLLNRAGFKDIKIRPMGGYFKFLGDVLRFNNLAEQWKKSKIIYVPLSIIDLVIFKILFPFVLFHLDSMDKEQKWSMGYTVEATK